MRPTFTTNTIVVLGNNLDHLVLMKPVCDVLKQVGFNFVYIAGDNWWTTGRYVTRLGYGQILSLLSDTVIFDKDLWSNSVLDHLKRYSPRWVFWWNGSTFPARNWKKSITDSYDVLYFEVGFLPQREHLFVDAKGVNSLSSFVNRSIVPIGAEEERRIELFIADYLKRQKVEPSQEQYDRDFILVPLQLEKDTQIELHSPWFSRMQDLIDFVCRSFPENKLIFKQHPLDINIYKLPDGADARIVKDGSLYSYIARSAAVVGINSTVCSEALLFNKPVATLGFGLFSSQGVTLECAHDKFSVTKVLAYRPNTQKIKQYLHDLLLVSQIRVGTVHGTRVDVEVKHINDISYNPFLAHVASAVIPDASMMAAPTSPLYTLTKHLSKFQLLIKKVTLRLLDMRI